MKIEMHWEGGFFEMRWNSGLLLFKTLKSSSNQTFKQSSIQILMLDF